MVTLDKGQWPQVMSTNGNAPGSNKQKIKWLYRNGFFCKLLSEAFHKMCMTRGQGQWPRVIGKNGLRKVSFEEACTTESCTAGVLKLYTSTDPGDIWVVGKCHIGVP